MPRLRRRVAVPSTEGDIHALGREMTPVDHHDMRMGNCRTK